LTKYFEQVSAQFLCAHREQHQILNPTTSHRFSSVKYCILDWWKIQHIVINLLNDVVGLIANYDP